jgi:RHS repeat-associated protein
MKLVTHFFQILILLFSAKIVAQLEEKSVRLEGSALQNLTTISIEDPKFGLFNSGSFASTNTAIDVNLGFNDIVGNTAAYQTVYKAKVTLEITRYNTNGSLVFSTPLVPNPQIKEFTIEHDNILDGITLKNFANMRLGGIHKATAKVMNIQYTNRENAAITVPNSTLYVELKFSTERYYNLKSTFVEGIVSKLVTYNGLTESAVVGAIANGEDELLLTWSKNEQNPAVEYELEWTWIDNYGETQDVQKEANLISLTEQGFKLNSTRIETKELSYRIPLVYAKGYLVYRIRPVGRFLDDTTKKYYGLWSSGLADGFQKISDWPHKIEIKKSHENGQKNWQFQSSYAEDGKKKEVVSYFDGTLRNRQTVTKLNTNNQSIVGEVVYDNQGRAAIEVLPVPIENKSIRFFDKLNKNASSNVFSHRDFDWEKINPLACEPTALGSMGADSGAGKYYAPQFEQSKTFQDFVPDAKGYPFSQTVYTPDNTGRISSKGGVGPMHQIGSGQEMKYLYPKPDQAVLNRLFGYKVGDALRYKQNIVIDPNKQISMSFIDPKGKTIATALSFNKPTNMVGLDDEINTTAKPIESNLLTSNVKYATGRFDLKQDGFKMSQPIVAAEDNSIFTLSYDLSHSTNTFESICLPNKYYPFVYDLSINMKNECGIEKLNRNEKVGLINVSNSTKNSPAVSFELKNQSISGLTKGTYFISKNLVINQESVNTYADDFVKTLKDNTNATAVVNGCYPNLVDYNVDISLNDCKVTCKNCELSLAKNNLSVADYNSFETMFPVDDLTASTESQIQQRASLLSKAKDQYVINKLSKIYTDVTFSYANSILTYSGATVNADEVRLYETNYRLEFDKSVEICRSLCATKVSSCTINLSQLLDDVSPKGQYGYSDSNIENSNTNDQSVSVFYEYNSLLKEGSVATNIPNEPRKKSNSSWKFPKFINSNGTTIRRYQESDGTNSTITVVKLENGDFVPSIDTTASPVLVTGETDKYTVFPENLTNVEDFIKEWRSSWAESLLMYHPEYNYYEYYKDLCDNKLNGKNTNDFDDELNTYDTFASIPTQPTNLFLSLQDIATSNDPYFDKDYSKDSDTTSPSNFSLRKSLMIEALKTNYDGISFEDAGVVYKLNMLQAAVYTVLFANGLAGQKSKTTFKTIITNNSSSTNNTNLMTFINSASVTDAQRDRIWMTFRGNYISFKTKIKTVFSNIYALKKGGYNGCIGEKENTDNYITLFKKYDATVYSNIVNKIDAALQTTLVASGAYSVCSPETYALYSQKTKRFISADYSYDSGVDDLQALNAIQTDTDTQMFVKTGKCALLNDMELLLNGLVNKDYNAPSGSVNFGTIQASNIPQFTSDLYTAMGGSLPTQNDVTMNSQIIGGNLNITVNDGATILSPIILKILPSAGYVSPCLASGIVADYPSWTNYNQSTVTNSTFIIKRFKNIYFIPGSSVGQQKFQVIAEITRPTSLPSCYEEIVIEGTTIAPIGDCKLDDGKGLSSFTSTGALSGCANRVDFQKSLEKILNTLKAKNKLTNTNLNLGAGFVPDSDQNLPIAGDYAYGNSFLAEFLKDRNANAIYNRASNGFTITLNGNNVIVLEGLTAWPPNNLNRITGITINQQLNGNEGNTITINYLYSQISGFTTKLLPASISGTIKGNNKPLDFACSCGKIRTSLAEAASANFLTLISHLWTQKQSNALLNPTNSYGYRSKEVEAIQPFVKGWNNPTDNYGVNRFTTTYDSSVYSQSQDRFLNYRGLRFYLNAASSPSCPFDLPLISYETDDVCGVENTTNYFNSITSFSNFKLINSASTDSKFTIMVSHGPYQERNVRNEYKTIPAGIDIKEGTISCLKDLFCKEKDNAALALNKIFNDLIRKTSVTDGYVANGLSSLMPYVQFPSGSGITSGIYDYSSSKNIAGNYISFKINSSAEESEACRINLEIPKMESCPNLVFEDLQFTDDSFVDFSVLVKGSCGEMATAKGSIPCLNIESCFLETDAPCPVACIPTPIVPVNCVTQWQEFKAKIVRQIPGYVLSSSLSSDNSFFCGANYAYISSQYLYYLSTFNIRTTTDSKYIDILTFGSSKLYYGYEGMNGAIDSYKVYLANNLNPRLTWVEYIDQVYTIKNTLCPPAPLLPNISVDVSEIKTPCEIFQTNITSAYKEVLNEEFFVNKRKEFIADYVKAAIENVKETFVNSADDKEYQYTLYYYDQAGNLIQTVPPSAVKQGNVDNRLPVTKAVNDQIDAIRKNNPDFTGTSLAGVKVLPTSSSLRTEYRYNSLNQLVYQRTPDGGITSFAYDKLGRIIASQNSKQATPSFGTTVTNMSFSYTKYDELGRIKEAGEIIIPFNPITPLFSINSMGRLVKSNTTIVDSFEDELNPIYNKREVTITYYDELESARRKIYSDFFQNYAADNSQKRVTAVLYFDASPPAIDETKYSNAIFYDYDVHGNVKELVNHNNKSELAAINQDKKSVLYDYDLISGNVNKVTYQYNKKDQFIHKYTYDADNRITDVFTSSDNVIWEKDANYKYYEHGPLARVEIGQNKVQGLDYVYTLQGWLKSVNGETTAGGKNDIGKDGGNVAQDAIAFALNYYNGDYLSRNNSKTAADNEIFTFSKGKKMEGNKDLYNGNIKEMVTSMLKNNQDPLNTQYNYYQYDQLNRIRQMDSENINPVGFIVQTGYKSDYKYDNNGNLKFLNRWASDASGKLVPTEMDKLTYNYAANRNRLLSVVDNAAPTSIEGDLEGTSNYSYDAIGQLTRDSKEQLTIDWRVDGKVRSVKKDNGVVISFEYDGLGNRIAKQVKDGALVLTTYYERDAQGNVLSTYKMRKEGTAAPEFTLTEQDIYGSSRLGVQKVDLRLDNLASQQLRLASDATKAYRTAATIVPLTGLRFNGNDNAIDLPNINQAKLSLFDGIGVKTNSVIIKSHFKIEDGDPLSDSNGNYPQRALMSLQDQYSVGLLYEDNGCKYLRNSLVLVVQKKKDVNGIISFSPTLKLIRYDRTYFRWRKNGKGKVAYQLNSKEVNYTIDGNIPQKEWDFKLELIEGSSPSDPAKDIPYNVLMTINGNTYKARKSVGEVLSIHQDDRTFGVKKDDGGKINAPDFVSSKFGRCVIYNSNPKVYDFPNRDYKALKAEVCDINYSVVNAQGHFNFNMPLDNSTSAVLITKIEDDGKVTPIANSFPSANGIPFVTTYCGSEELDSDKDGIKDTTDNCPFAFNPKQEDADGDRAGNVCDNCIEPNPDQLDSDEDGRGDFCDNCDFKSNFDQIDTDGDGYGDTCDNCKLTANSQRDANGVLLPQVDTDNDGIGDVCEGEDQGQAVAEAIKDPKESYNTAGDKNYELSNHLGNVLSVISDRKLFNNNTSTVTYLTTFDTAVNPWRTSSTKKSSVAVDINRLKVMPTQAKHGAVGTYNLLANKIYNLKFDIKNPVPALEIFVNNTLGELVYTTKITSEVANFNFTTNIAGNYRITVQVETATTNPESMVFYIDNVTITDVSSTAGIVSTSQFKPDVLSFSDYYPFGQLVPNRHGSADSYRYGFNGMEKDDELKGEGNSLDFGARMLDPRVGRWFARDPKSAKYPHESPYVYVSNNPIVCIDPDGEEKIVISGGADLHNKNRLNFIMGAKAQLRNYLNEVKKAKSGENVTWIIFDLDYTSAEKKQFDAYAKKNGLSKPVYVKTADEVKNYLNSKTTVTASLSVDRLADQVTDVSAMSHGIPSTIAFGYENTGYDMTAVDKTDFNSDVAKKLDSNAFATGCEIDIFSCNSATPEVSTSADFPTRKELTDNTLKLPNLVKDISKATKQTATGYIGRTNYVPVVQGKLPSAGKTGGDYSPTVAKKSIKSVKVTSKNGKTTTN